MARNYDVDVIEVNRTNSTIKVKFDDGNESDFNIVAPAKIDYAKVGKATIGVDGNNVGYIRAIVVQENTQTQATSPTSQTTTTQATATVSYDNIDRQVLIVRQNSYAHAVEVAKMKLQLEADFDKKDILEQIKQIAHSIEDDVFR